MPRPRSRRSHRGSRRSRRSCKISSPKIGSRSSASGSVSIPCSPACGARRAAFCCDPRLPIHAEPLGGPLARRGLSIAVFCELAQLSAEVGQELVARLALDHPLASYGLLIAADDYATHEERFQFFYRPDKKRFDQPSGESFTAMFKKVVVLSEDKKTASLVNDGIYKDSLYEFKVQNVGTVRPYSSQGRTGVVLPIVVAFARRPPESKINTSDVGWVTPAINRDYNLLLPFEAEP